MSKQSVDTSASRSKFKKTTVLVKSVHQAIKQMSPNDESALNIPATTVTKTEAAAAAASARKGRGDFQTVIQHYTQLSLSTENIRKLFSDAVRSREMTTVNINGRFFDLPTSTCVRIPTLRDQMYERGMLLPPSQSKGRTRELFFERNATIFIAIVDYVSNCELHVPREVCPKLFAKEITFWGFDIEEVEPCCFPALMHFLWEQDKLARFQGYLYNKADTSPSMLRRNFLNDESVEDWNNLSGMAYFRAIAWGVLDEPFSSRYAQGYFAIMCIFISLSFFSMAAETNSYFQKNCSLHDANSVSNATTEPMNIYTGVDLNLMYLEIVWSTYFYLDYFLRILFYPHLRHFFKDVINITDGLAIFSTIANSLLRVPGQPDCWVETHHSYSYVLDLPKLFRTFRLIRPMSKLTGFRLMWFTLKCSFHELMLVLMLLMFLVVFFSSLIYYLGDKDKINNIPEAMWFTVITMTTVGYGDVVPSGWRSMVIGSVVAVFGVIMMSMTTPIMVSNFHSLYINAVVGEPSTIKKVRYGMDKAQGGSSTSLSKKTTSEATMLSNRSRLKSSTPNIPDTKVLLTTNDSSRLSRFLSPMLDILPSLGKKSSSKKLQQSAQEKHEVTNASSLVPQLMVQDTDSTHTVLSCWSRGKSVSSIHTSKSTSPNMEVGELSPDICKS